MCIFGLFFVMCVRDGTSRTNLADSVRAREFSFKPVFFHPSKLSAAHFLSVSGFESERRPDMKAHAISRELPENRQNGTAEKRGGKARRAAFATVDKIEILSPLR